MIQYWNVAKRRVIKILRNKKILEEKIKSSYFSPTFIDVKSTNFSFPRENFLKLIDEVKEVEEAICFISGIQRIIFEKYFLRKRSVLEISRELDQPIYVTEAFLRLSVYNFLKFLKSD